MTTKHQVIAMHLAHPTWNSGRIAYKLGCLSAYVRTTAVRNKIKLPSAQNDVPRLKERVELLEKKAKELRRRIVKIERAA